MKLVLHCSLLLSIAFVHSSADHNLIETTCRNTPNYRLCLATLRGSATADVSGLALTAVRAVEEKTKEAIATVNRLKRRAHGKLLGALQECSRVYNAVVVADVPEAVAALTEGDPKFAENGMADAAVEADVCEGGVEGAGAAPVRRVNKAVSDLAQVARAIIRNLL